MKEYPVIDLKATGNRINAIRKAQGLRVQDIADYMGFESVQAVYKWFHGESLPTVENLWALSYLLESPIESILVGYGIETEAHRDFEREESESSLLPFYGLAG